MFSLGLVVAALAPSQTVASGLSGLLMFLSFFFAGLWIQPVQVGGPLETIMYYSPAGAAVRALLYSVFNSPPPYETVGNNDCLHNHFLRHSDTLLPLGMMGLVRASNFRTPLHA